MTDCFLTDDFIKLNCHKVDEIIKLEFISANKSLGTIFLGRKKNLLLSPFSAPYGGLLPKPNLDLNEIKHIAHELMQYVHASHLQCIITFPAKTIDDDFAIINEFLCNILIEKGAKIKYINLNYHLPVNHINFNRNQLRNLKKSCRSGYIFKVSQFDEDHLKSIYNVIQENHTLLGYNISMTLDEFIATSSLIDFILFSVIDINGVVIAGAISYLTRPKIIQVIQWADNIKNRSQNSGMAFLAYNIIQWVQHNRPEISVIDLGPASNRGEVSVGLANFKRQLGAIETHKYTLTIDWNLDFYGY